jgi:UV DNA damage endonuclease
MLRWNHKYGIKFMRLSSEMFPFASHAEYGYKLAPFASEALAEAGKVVTELGHRVSTHPGQFTQLGSPRAEVIANAIRDLEYHDEMLSLLKLPEQEDRDAVMILHMGGTFGDKGATLDRFRENYKDLSPSIKQRLVLENDDVSWSVHDLLPVCEELNVPLCLDFHHHNIIFDSSQIREGTLDIMALYPRIKATWDRKRIRQKMHYSEGRPEAITGRQRRKHNPRPITLPPCPNDMDLMIEAKDKEQAIFELMRTFKLPGWDTFNNIIPYERADDNKPLPRRAKKKKTKKQILAEVEEFGKELSEDEVAMKEQIPEEEIGMGGKESRVYWPVGMEEWLRPKKREIKKKGSEDEEEIFKNPTPANFAARKAIIERNRAPLSEEVKNKLRKAASVADIQKVLEEIKAGTLFGTPFHCPCIPEIWYRSYRNVFHNIRSYFRRTMVLTCRTERQAVEEAFENKDEEVGQPSAKKLKSTATKKLAVKKSSPSNLDDEDGGDLSMPGLSSEEGGKVAPADRIAVNGVMPARQSRRASRKSYAEVDGVMDEE